MSVRSGNSRICFNFCKVELLWFRGSAAIRESFILRKFRPDRQRVYDHVTNRENKDAKIAKTGNLRKFNPAKVKALWYVHSEVKVKSPLHNEQHSHTNYKSMHSIHFQWCLKNCHTYTANVASNAYVLVIITYVLHLILRVMTAMPHLMWSAVWPQSRYTEDATTHSPDAVYVTLYTFRMYENE